MVLRKVHTRTESTGTSRKRKLDDAQNSQARSASTTEADASLNDPGVSISSTQSNQNICMTSNTDGSSMEACRSATNDPPPKRRRRLVTTPSPSPKREPIEQPRTIKQVMKTRQPKSSEEPEVAEEEMKTRQQKSIEEPEVAKETTQDKKDNSVAKERDECPICQQKYRKSDEKKFLPCAHNFHKTCVNKWLRTHDTCPICRHVTTDAYGPTSARPRTSVRARTSARVSLAARVSSADNFPSEADDSTDDATPLWQQLQQLNEQWEIQLLEQKQLLDLFEQRFYWN